MSKVGQPRPDERAPSQGPSRRHESRWTADIGGAWQHRATGSVVAWSAMYLGLSVYWLAGGSGFPFGRNDVRGPESGSLLSSVDQRSAAPVLALLVLVAAVTAWAMHLRAGSGRWWRVLVIASGVVVIVALTGVGMDARSITLMPPLGLVGWTMIGDWPTLHQLLLGLGAVAWIAALTAYVGTTGRAHGTERGAERTLRWVRAGRVGTLVAVLCPLPYAVIRWSWALGVPLGAPRSFVEMLGRNQPGVAMMEAVLATLACVGALLAAGLAMPWGQRLPRWFPLAGGRPVPVWVPLSLGTSAAIAILPFGLGAWHGLLGVHVAGTLSTHQAWGLDLTRPAFWGVNGLAWLFPLWALALGVALVGYWLGRRERGSDGRRSAPSARTMRRTALLSTTAGVLVGVVTIVALPEHGQTPGWVAAYSPVLREPSGPRPVGVRDVHMVDSSRRHGSNADSPRELMATVFYPADPKPTEGTALADHAFAPYVSESIAQRWGHDLSRALGLRTDAINWQFRIGARIHAPPARGRFPVLIATPPFERPRSTYTTLAQDLASHGHVVVTLDHTDESLVEFTGRRLEDAGHPHPARSGPRRAVLHRARAQDVTFVATHLRELGSELGSIVDATRVGAFGYLPLRCDEYGGLAGGQTLDAVLLLGTRSWCRPDTHATPPQMPTLAIRGRGDPSISSVLGEVGPGAPSPLEIATTGPREVCTDSLTYLPAIARRFPEVHPAAPRLAPVDAAVAMSTCRRGARRFFDAHLALPHRLPIERRGRP